MNNSSTIDQLKSMKFSSMAKEFESQLMNPKSYAQLGFEERLGLLVDAEWNRRQANKLLRRIRDAHLDIPSATIEEIEYYADRELDKAEMIRYSTCQYIDAEHHIIIKGASGSGKTYLGCALGNAACRKLKSVRYVIVPNSVDGIEECVFQVSTQIVSIILPDKEVCLDFRVFANCTKLKHVMLPRKDKICLCQTFYNCSSLSEIELPEYQDYVGQYCFYRCVTLQRVVMQNVERIRKAAFSGCMSLKMIVFPASLRQIDYRAFCDCESLTELIIPEGVERIGERAFAGCKNIKHVTLPKSLKRIGEAIFEDCSELSVESIDWLGHTIDEKKALFKGRYYPLNIKKFNDIPIYQEICRKERAERGFCESDWSNIDDYLIRLIADMLEEFADLHDAYPNDMTSDQWDTILNEIAMHFRNALDWRRIDLPNDILASVIQQSMEKPELKRVLDIIPPELVHALQENRLSEANEINGLLNELADKEVNAGFDMLKKYIDYLWD